MNCALVSHTWQSAAMAATINLVFNTFRNKSQPREVAEWLLKHGKQVEGITLQHVGYNMMNHIDLSMPFQQITKLRSFSSQGFHAALGAPLASGSHLNPLSAVSNSLTSLKLNSSMLDGLPDGWSSLSVLTSLQELELQQAKTNSSSGFSDIDSTGLSQALLQPTDLTQLKLIDQKLDQDARLAIGACSLLGCLQVQQEHRHHSSQQCTGDSSKGLFMQFPSGFTRLELLYDSCFNNTTVPQLSTLTALKHLQLDGGTGFDSELLYDMQQLTHVQLNMLYQDFDANMLLEALRNMQQLQHLCIAFKGDSLTFDYIGYGADYFKLGAFSWSADALLSSAHLTSLELIDVPLDKGTVGSMFRLAGHQPQLRIGKVKYHDWSVRRSKNPPISSSDFDSLTRSCPSLVELNLKRALQDDVDMSGLLQLHNMQKLTISGPSTNDYAAEHVLAHMSALRSLKILQGGYTVEGLTHRMRLAALRSFTVNSHCCIFDGDRSSSDCDWDSAVKFMTEDPTTQTSWDKCDSPRHKPPYSHTTSIGYHLHKNPEYLKLLLRKKDEELSAFAAQLSQRDSDYRGAVARNLKLQLQLAAASTRLAGHHA